MITFKMSDKFGSSCAVGNKAVIFLEKDVLPAFEKGDSISFDFEGVKNMNSSFSNALFANLVHLQGQHVIEKIEIKNATDRLKAEVKSSVALGLSGVIVGPPREKLG